MPFASAALDDLFGMEPGEVENDASLIFERIEPEDRTCVEASIAESAKTMESGAISFA